MSSMMAGNFFPIFIVVAFLAVVLLLEGLYMMWNTYKGPEVKKVGQRLRALSGSFDNSERGVVLKNRMLSDLPIIERWLLKIPRIAELDRFLLQSGLDMTVSGMVLVSLLFGVTAYIILSFVGLLLLIHFGMAAGLAFLPFFYVQWKRSGRLRKMEQQLPDALDLIGRALRSGHALPSSLQMVSEEMTDPVAGEFRITHDEINFGVSMQQALLNLGERIPIADMRYFIVAVLIQREAGGNLTEVLGNLSTLIRSRLKFNAKVRLLTTEGRMSAWIMGLLPFALAGLFNLLNHDFISTLWTDPIGIKISKVVLTIMAIGAVWLWRLVQIRV